MFGRKPRNAYTSAYGTRGNPDRGHVGQNKVLDDGAIYAYCTCGWSLTSRDGNVNPLVSLSGHLSNSGPNRT